MNTDQLQQQESLESSISLPDLLKLFLSHWRWFVLSLVICMSLGMLYLSITQPVYTRSTSILIKEDKENSASTGDLSAFQNLGLFQGSSKVQNELITIQSPVIITEVVRRLGLNVNYSVRTGLRSHTLYGTELPLRLQLLDHDPEEGSSLVLSPSTDGGLVLDQFVSAGEKLQQAPIKARYGDTIKSPIGRLLILPVQGVSAQLPQEVKVSISRIDDTANGVLSGLKGTLVDDKSTVIQLTYNDVSAQRAEDILSTIVSVYNELWVEDKNQVAVSTSRFIDERLDVIQRDLGAVDGDISKFKSRNLLPNVDEVTRLVLDKSKDAEAQLLLLSNQISMARYIRSYILDERNQWRVLPANSGIGSDHVESLIGEYNKNLILYNRLKANSSEANPRVLDLEHTLTELRSAVSKSLDNVIVSLSTQINSLQASEQRNTSRIASSPEQAKYLISIERQQKIKEALYLYLLQKREETQLKQSFAAYNTRVITPPTGSRKPSSPVTRNILLASFVLGLILPAVAIFAIDTFDTKLRGRKDAEVLSIPYLGQIPDMNKYRSLRTRLAQRFGRLPHDSNRVRPLVVTAAGGDQMNEAFRILRTNIQYMLPKDRAQVVMLSSINPASGKTFITLNLANSFALKGKRVAVLDLDLRRALLSLYINRPKPGLSSFLNGEISKVSELRYTHPDMPGLDIYPVGIIPPNPAELLSTERLSELLDQLRPHYDLILIDCPPAEIVADASIITEVVDMTLFVLRVGVLDKRLLPELERFYRENKYRQMTYVVNGVDQLSSKYGYNYGYGDYYAKSK